MKRPVFFLAALLFAACTSWTHSRSPGMALDVPTKASQEATTPSQALERPLRGNERFLAARPQKRDMNAAVKATAPGQYPFAAVLGCIDSRVPPEVIFDQGLGEIFTARIAGNVVDEDILGSLEYATQEAGARLILVLGHTHCGAVKAACQGVRLEHVDAVLEKIQPAIALVSKKDPSLDTKSQHFIDAVAEANVRRSVSQILEKSSAIRALAQSGRIAVRGAVYDVETGAVRVLE